MPDFWKPKIAFFYFPTFRPWKIDQTRNFEARDFILLLNERSTCLLKPQGAKHVHLKELCRVDFTKLARDMGKITMCVFNFSEQCRCYLPLAPSSVWVPWSAWDRDRRTEGQTKIEGGREGGREKGGREGRRKGGGSERGREGARERGKNGERERDIRPLKNQA